MKDIEEARVRWIKERPKYEEFGRFMKERITRSLRRLGFWYTVQARAKGVDSMVKKLIKKSDHTYDTLPDKAGGRVVVRYRSNVDAVISVVRTTFDCKEPENKLGKLGFEKVGYLSVHLDNFRLQETDWAAAE
jgi:ppGpp synthetase/RelA/SpoT-type nucleotidyltranferase